MIVNKNTNYNFLGESKNKRRSLLSKEKKLKQEGTMTYPKDKKVFLTTFEVAPMVIRIAI